MSSPTFTRSDMANHMKQIVKYLESEGTCTSIVKLQGSPYFRVRGKHVLRYCVHKMNRLGLLNLSNKYTRDTLVKLNTSSELYERIKKPLPFDGINKSVNRQLVYQYASDILTKNVQPRVLILGGPYLHDLPEIFKHNNNAVIDSIERDMHSYICAAMKSKVEYKNNNITIHHTDIHSFLEQTATVYDVIYLDYCNKIRDKEAETISLAMSKLSDSGQLAVTVPITRLTPKFLKQYGTNQVDAMWNILKQYSISPLATIKYHDVIAMGTFIICRGKNKIQYKQYTIKDMLIIECNV